MTEDYQLRLLYDLIKDGELYEDYIRFSGRISEYYQTDFLAWRYQVISQLRSIGSPFSDLVVKSKMTIR
jgi:hypothetical protein